MIVLLIILLLGLFWCLLSIHCLCEAIEEIMKSIDELEEKVNI